MDAPSVEVEVEGEVAAPADRPGTASSVVVDDRLRPSADLGDALQTVPGLHIRRLGGLGAFTTVTLRGATARQVELQLDGIPLNPDGATAVDLSEWPVWAFERVDVWRGIAPIAAGPGGAGGVINLVTGDRAAAQGAVAGGSFGTSTGRMLWSGPSGPAGKSDGLIALDAFATAGGFPYLADGGTPFTTLDDRIASRANADKRQVSAQARWRSHGWTVLESALARDEGVPGFTTDITTASRYTVWRDLLAIRRTGAWGGARWTTSVWGVGRDEALADPRDEIGIGVEQVHDRAGSVGGVAQLAVAPTSGLRADGVVDLRLDGWGRVGEPAMRASRRVARIGVGGAGFGRGWSVEPGFWALAFDDRQGDAVVPRVSALPRVAARVQLAPPVALHGQLGRSVRPPDLDELFGDRGAWVGNPDLRAEQAWSADVGADVAADAWSLSAVGFWTEATDRIVFVQNAQQVAQPINLAAASLRGVEVGAAVGARGLDASLAATWTDAVQRSADPTYDGNPLPRVPAWEIQSTVSGARGPVQLGGTSAFVAGTWLDSAGFQQAGPRWILGAFGRLTLGQWQITADIRNVANRIAEVGPRDPLVDDGSVAVRAMTDFLGYPLPGRVALVGLVWSR